MILFIFTSLYVRKQRFKLTCRSADSLSLYLSSLFVSRVSRCFLSIALWRQFGCCLVGHNESTSSIMQNVSVETAWQPPLQRLHPVSERESLRNKREGTAVYVAELEKAGGEVKNWSEITERKKWSCFYVLLLILQVWETYPVDQQTVPALMGCAFRSLSRFHQMNLANYLEWHKFSLIIVIINVWTSH